MNKIIGKKRKKKRLAKKAWKAMKNYREIIIRRWPSGRRIGIVYSYKYNPLATRL